MLRCVLQWQVQDRFLLLIWNDSYPPGKNARRFFPDASEVYRFLYPLPIKEDMQQVEGLERIRLGSLEPRIITEHFAKRLSELSKVCPHFHLSLQSGCDSVLKRMNRHYSAEEYFEKVQILRKYYEHPAITTDIITGFPQETEDEFAQTVEFVKKVNFYETHIFRYSKRQGTPAAKMNAEG